MKVLQSFEQHVLMTIGYFTFGPILSIWYVFIFKFSL